MLHAIAVSSAIAFGRRAIEVQEEILALMDGRDFPQLTFEEAQKKLERYQAAAIEQADDDGSR